MFLYEDVSSCPALPSCQQTPPTLDISKIFMGVTVFKHLNHHLCVKKSDSELFQCQVYVYVCWNFKTKSHKIQTNLLFINRQGNSVWKDKVWGMIKKVKKKNSVVWFNLCRPFLHKTVSNFKIIWELKNWLQPCEEGNELNYGYQSMSFSLWHHTGT